MRPHEQSARIIVRTTEYYSKHVNIILFFTEYTILFFISNCCIIVLDFPDSVPDEPSLSTNNQLRSPRVHFIVSDSSSAISHNYYYLVF